MHHIGNYGTYGTMDTEVARSPGFCSVYAPRLYYNGFYTTNKPFESS